MAGTERYGTEPFLAAFHKTRGEKIDFFDHFLFGYLSECTHSKSDSISILPKKWVRPGAHIEFQVPCFFD